MPRLRLFRPVHAIHVLLAVAFAILVGAAHGRRSAPPFAFAVDLSTTATGRVQVYYDIGRGLSEADSVSMPVQPGPATSVRLPLPEAIYGGIRFDPINTAATVTFAHPRITGAGGKVVRELDPAAFTPNSDVATYSVHGSQATLRVPTGRDDPNLLLRFESPLALRFGFSDRLRLEKSVIIASFVIAFLLLLAADFLWRTRARLHAWARRRPVTALWVVAIIAGVLASYPVVFAGKSFVAPNTTALLYQGPPTVPGFADRQQTDLHAADPAVLLWQNVPYGIVEHTALARDHELPLWNRYHSSGVTLLGQGQSMLGDPVHLLVIAANGASWAWDAKFVLAKILFAAGVALAVWKLTGDLFAAALAATAAPFVAFYSFRFNHPAVFTLSYAPWILAAWAMLARAPSQLQLRGPLALLALANLSVLGSGTVKEAYALLFALNVAGLLIWGLAEPPDRERKRRHLLPIALTGACTLAITAPLWLTFFDALRAATTSYTAPVVWQAPRAWLIGLFDSLFYVELNPAHRGFLPSANFLILLGVVFAVVKPPGRLMRAPHVVILSLGAVASVLLAFEFIPARWIAAVPLLRSVYHVHNTFCVVAVVLLAVLGGCGFHCARLRLAERRPWTPIIGGAGVVAVLLGIYFHDLPKTWLSGPGLAGWWHRAPEHMFFYVNLVLMLSACGGLVTIAQRRIRTGITPPRAAIIAAACLVVLLYRHGLHINIGLGESYLTFPMPRGNLTAPSPAIEAARKDAGAEPFRIIGTDANLINGFNTVYDVESINGPDAIMNHPYRDFMVAAGLVPATDWRAVVNPGQLEAQRPILDFLGVRYVVSNVPTVSAGTGYVKIASLDLELYRSDTAWPRAFFTPRLVPYATTGDFIALLRRRKGGAFAAVRDRSQLISLPGGKFPGGAAGEETTDEGQAGADVNSARPAIVPAHDYHRTANTTAFTIEAPSAGIAVLQETWAAGDFKATLDGAPVPYFRVNEVFKGIVIPRAGEYRVKFSYWPQHLTAALWIATAGLLGFVALLVGLGRRRDESVCSPADLQR